jgi:predicted O-methyltransferase YrrM
MIHRTNALNLIVRVLEILVLPITALSGIWLKAARMYGFRYLPASKWLLGRVGIMPVRDHYYEPMINPVHLRHSLSKERNLPAVDLNVQEQLAVLEQFSYQEELMKFPLDKAGELQFYYHNASFEAGDAEYLYSILRLKKPRRIVEIGSGFSTLIARSALIENQKDVGSQYQCDHVCIEPYEQPWLEKLGTRVIRRRVEECGFELFTALDRDDVLFIDSSHVIRPQGDVLYEFLELLPLLRPGVLVHVHDIFTPRDYPRGWIVDEIRLWNEQYLLEGFLSFNSQFRIIGAVNFLTRTYPTEISRKFPILKMEIEKEPGSFWMIRQ